MRFPLILTILGAVTLNAHADIENTVVADGLRDPMQLAELPSGDLLVIEREGRIVRVHPQTGAVCEVGQVEVVACRETDPKSNYAREDGLLGLAVDPQFEKNSQVYLYYSHPKKMVNQISRFVIRNGALDLASEQVLLEIPVQRNDRICHNAGCLQFDKDGLLYLSVGDNTNPFGSTGAAPIDEREGKDHLDAMRSAGNTNDLRGKVVRIRPTAKGYEIPKGNLFPPGTPKTRPEIYAMGCRNPFRLSVDERTGTVYWGEVGPDADKDSVFGPRGYDEINQARKAGNFGWPFVIANNQPYAKRDFTVEKPAGPLPMQDPAKPENYGHRNTGLKELPPAQSAFIWYPYKDSAEFPVMGTGSRNAMAGPVFYYDPARPFNILPKEADGTLLTYDWARGGIWQAKLGKDESLQKLDKWVSGLTHPMDIKMARDGSLWLLEYGKGWYFNRDGKVRRLRPEGASPAPALAAKALPGGLEYEVDKVAGDAKLRWWLTRGSTEQDLGDAKRVKLDSAEAGSELRAVATTAKGGVAIVRFPLGKSAERPLKLEFAKKPKAFGFGETVAFTVSGTNLDGKDVVVRARYIPPTGHDAGGPQFSDELKALATQRQCFACHQVDKTSVGPSYLDVAMRYAGKEGIEKQLVSKVLTGGGGVWGQVPMPAQAAPEADVVKLVGAIRALATGMSETRGKAKGDLVLPAQVQGSGEGAEWEFTAEAPGYTMERVRVSAK